MASIIFHYIFNHTFCLILLLQFQIILVSKEIDNIEPKRERVEMRAVFINCEPSDSQGAYPDNEATRFQREELFKHSTLQGCRKKLALTLKLSNEPEAENDSGDEYIPIEHVFDGSNKKRVRLFNPYILRIRREAPLQAYKLRLIETVTGIISPLDGGKSTKPKKIRSHRQFKRLSEEIDDRTNSRLGDTDADITKTDCEGKVSHLNTSSLLDDTSSSIVDYQYKGRLQTGSYTRVKRDVCTANSAAWNRDKRNEHNIIVENTIDDDKIPWVAPDPYYQNHKRASVINKIIDKPKITNNNNVNYSKSKIIKSNHRTRTSDLLLVKNAHENEEYASEKVFADQKSFDEDSKNFESNSKLKHVTHHNTVDKDIGKISIFNYDSGETGYDLYEIGKPDLWYSVHVQLFEKMSTPEGKTAWNDITDGEIASVSSVEPEWRGQDINIKYRSNDFISKDEFTLPSDTRLCLLASVNEDTSKNTDEDNGISRKYIVVPMDDIVNMGDENPLSKRDGNRSEDTTDSIMEEQHHRRVLIRVSRALLAGNEDDIKISSNGSNKFLVMPYRRIHRAQIDLEARADSNELIRVGSSGSLITIVADNSRRTRSSLTVQATNKGLAAARFRVKVRDCSPDVNDMIRKSSEQLITDPVLIAPRHTHRFVVELPLELPLDVTHCSIALVNDEDESIAVREVAIKKGDRCFCIWHCDCVCLDEDPKLLCREMADARQVAAGLSPRGRARRARFACYPDILCVNISVIIMGVLVALLMLGLLKAISGLFFHCIAKWGLYRLIQTPRKLEKYHEYCLKNRNVVYDDEGWPVHPDTKKRTVRLLSKEMEFVLNLIFFIAVPSLMLWDAIKWLRCVTSKAKKETRVADDKMRCFSTQDMQGMQPRRHRRRAGLQRWMTTPAEELSKDIWNKGLRPVECEFMRPLLAERQYRPDDMSSCLDSEQDDAEYVLTQMHKSKESLAKSQRKIIESEPSTVRKQLNVENSTRNGNNYN